MTPDADLAIVGSGFGGTLLAMVARQLGLRVMLLERGQHPRFAIGESASPLAGVIIEQLADRYALPRLKPLASHGEWRRQYPDVVCGLKRGFTYFKHEAGRPYRAAEDRSNQLLVAASPCDEVSDTHWLRSDVDHFLVREAVALGVEYLDRVELDAVEWAGGGGPTLTGRRMGQNVRMSVRAVVDASGPRGFLGRALGIAAATFDAYPATQGLYSHFTGVAQCASMPEFATRESPYPIDAAALHHVFDGGWMWVLRFDNGVTSAGIAVIDSLAGELRLADGEAAWTRFLARYPSIQAQLAGARPIREFTWMPRVASRLSRAAGDRWALLPSAAAFVDPLFSTGIPLTLLGVERLSRALETGEFFRSSAPEDARRAGHAAQGPEPAAPPWLPARYEQTTLAEADHTARFIAGCYAAFPQFDRFTAYSMFYFAAASFSEMARRLNRPASGFLGQGDAAFADAMSELSPARFRAQALPGSRADASRYEREVADAVDRLNIAGLCDPTKRNWYPVDLEDTIRAAAKLGVTPDAVRGVFESRGDACVTPTCD